MKREHKTQFAILGALSVAAMSGYEIKKWVRETTGPFWSESSGQVYPTLAKLEAEGAIYCRSEEAHGKRVKKTYAITEPGLELLKSWLARPAEQAIERSEFLLKLFYGKNLRPAKLIEHLEREKQRARDDLASYEKILQDINLHHKNNPNAKFWRYTLKNALMHINTELAWCDEVLNDFINNREEV